VNISEQEFKNKVAEILKDYSNYSAQTESYIIHGALQKIWELHLMNNINKLLEELQHDPYPEDIFPPVNKKQLKEIHLMLKEKFNMPLDRLSAHIARELRKGLKSLLKIG
jgi:hypothetical protein